jgi:hypothetical protein
VRPLRPTLSGWILGGALLAALLLLAVLLHQLNLAPGTTTADGGNAELDPESRRTIYVLAVSLISILLLVVFLVSLYLLVRMGQALKRPSVGGPPTRYVDAWSQYRLSEDAVRDATHEEPGSSDPPRPDTDEGPP